MARDVAECIVDMAEQKESHKEFIVAQMLCGYIEAFHNEILNNASACLVGRKGSPNHEFELTSLDDLLSVGWRIERQFSVTKFVDPAYPYALPSRIRNENVMIDVQHFILSKMRV